MDTQHTTVVVSSTKNDKFGSIILHPLVIKSTLLEEGNQRKSEGEK